MIQIESPFEVGQKVFDVFNGEIAKVKIIGAYKDLYKNPNTGEEKETILYVILNQGKPNIIPEFRVFGTFEEAKKQAEKNLKDFIEEKAQKEKDKIVRIYNDKIGDECKYIDKVVKQREEELEKLAELKEEDIEEIIDRIPKEEKK